MAEVMATFEVEARARARGDDGRFTQGLNAASDEGAFKVGQHIADNAAANCWSESLPIQVVGGGGGEVEVIAQGPKAALEHEGSPPHAIDTDKYSLYNEAEGFPSIISFKTGKPIQVQHVNHPGFQGDHFLEAAGDSSFGYGISVVAAFLP